MSKQKLLRNTAGRPSKYSEEIQRKICNAIRRGNFAVNAARLVDINESTFYRWMAASKNGNPKYGNFYESVHRAVSQSEDNLLSKLIDSGDVKTLTWVLERRHKAKWGLNAQEEGLDPDDVGDVCKTKRQELIEKLSNVIADASRDDEEGDETHTDV